MKKTFINFGMALVISAAFFSAGCDTNKEERASLLRQISTRESEITRLTEQRTAIWNKNNQLKTELTQLANNLEQSRQRDTRLKDAFAEYLLEHKLVTAAIIAMGGAAAGIVDKNTDQETRETLAGVAIVGAAICLFNADECADVTSKIMYYGSEIDSVNRSIDNTISAISSKKALFQSNEKEYIALTNQFNSKIEDRNSLKQKHDELICKFCL